MTAACTQDMYSLSYDSNLNNVVEGYKCNCNTPQAAATVKQMSRPHIHMTAHRCILIQVLRVLEYLK